LSLSGAIAAFVIGGCHVLVGFTPTILLVLFYLTSSAWTKYKSSAKAKIEDGHKEGGQRDWVQVIANGGSGVVATLIYLSMFGPNEKQIDFILAPNASSILCAIIGIYAAANGDTWSSEIGSLSSGLPRLITTFREVPKGTNGAVSLLGLLSSIAAGFVIGVGAFVSQVFFMRSPASAMWPLILLGAASGFVGSLIDSFLGATVQYSGLDQTTRKVVSVKTKTTRHISGYNFLDNNEVNLLSIILTGLLSLFAAPWFLRLGTYV
jgi:uncharacterized protein (TIGR00297 family)